MVTKTIKMPESLDARLRRSAKAQKKTYSSFVREAILRGLENEKGVNMGEVLIDFIGAGEGPGDLSSNKNYFRDFGRKRAR